jgi:hypothetical protein
MTSEALTQTSILFSEFIREFTNASSLDAIIGVSARVGRFRADLTHSEEGRQSFVKIAKAATQFCKIFAESVNEEENR